MASNDSALSFANVRSCHSWISNCRSESDFKSLSARSTVEVTVCISDCNNSNKLLKGILSSFWIVHHQNQFHLPQLNLQSFLTFQYRIVYLPSCEVRIKLQHCQTFFGVTSHNLPPRQRLHTFHVPVTPRFEQYHQPKSIPQFRTCHFLAL
jgi:hypothetical protein